MTVEKLIAKLQKYDGKLPVHILVKEDEMYVPLKGSGVCVDKLQNNEDGFLARYEGPNLDFDGGAIIKSVLLEGDE